jgi:hypothetical protein
MLKSKSIKPINIVSKNEMKRIFGGEDETCGQCWAGPYSCETCRPVTNIEDGCTPSHCYAFIACSDILTTN